MWISVSDLMKCGSLKKKINMVMLGIIQMFGSSLKKYYEWAQKQKLWVWQDCSMYNEQKWSEE